ncbi:MAG: hypothetical protein ACI4VE_05225 [Clostridia bacterium]
MNRFFRWYRNHKVIFLIGVLATILGILLIKTYIKEEREIINEDDVQEYISYNESTVKSTKSAITYKEVESNVLETANKTIDKFITLLNENNYVEAYNLLSKDCKSELYPDIDDFKVNYYDENFKTYKSYTMQNWFNNTYKIEYRESLLDNGGIKTESFIRDYITVVLEKNEYKLNINNFIGIEEINKKIENQGVEIEIINKSVYMNYEIYKISVKNNLSQKINLCNLQEIDNIYLLDDKNIRYYAYLNELTEAEIQIPGKIKTNLNIKFITNYTEGKRIQKIIFQKIFLQSEENYIKIVCDII